jgi:hypothetical protein
MLVGRMRRVNYFPAICLGDAGRPDFHATFLQPLLSTAAKPF